MVFSENFFSSGASPSNPNGPGGPAPQPDAIGESLRVRKEVDPKSIKRSGMTPGARSWTWSGWAKLAGQAMTLFTPRIDITQTSGSVSSGLRVSGDFIWQANQAGSGNSAWNNIQCRDCTGWSHYHCSVNRDDDTINLYLNGKHLASGVADTYAEFGDALAMGYGGTAYGPGNMGGDSDGYLAEIHLIDGQALPPTVFGEYNELGIWRPIEPAFGKGQVRYSDFLFTDLVNTGAGATPNVQTTNKTNIDASGPAPLAFDGSTASRSYISGFIGSWFVFRPPTAIPVTSSLRVWTEGGNMAQIWLNGANSNFTNTGTTTWQDVPLNGATTIENLSLQGNPSSSASAVLFAIEVDGEILTNPFLWSSQIYTATSNDPTSTDKNFNTGANANAASSFDDNGNSWAQSVGSDNWLVFRLDTPITNVNSLAVTCTNNLTEIYVNGDSAGTVTATGNYNEHLPISLPAGFSGTLETLVIKVDQASNVNYPSRFIVNGTTLIDGVNGSYGANGFHLEFKDPNDLGHDSSGNGNHMEMVGFNNVYIDGGSLLGNTGTPANQQVALGTVQLGSLPQLDLNDRAMIYDIDFGSERESFSQRYRTTNMENRWMQIFTSNTGLADSWTQIDERQFGPAANAAYEIELTFPSPARYLRFTQTATQGATWQTGVWNLQFVDDSTNVDYDWFEDSPTINAATGNPLLVATGGEKIATQSANLAVPTGNSQGGAVKSGFHPTIYWNADDHKYFEVYVSDYPFNTYMGYVTDPGPNCMMSTLGASSCSGFYSMISAGSGNINSPSSKEGTLATVTFDSYVFQPNVTAGWEWDGPNRVIRYYENGVLKSTSSEIDTTQFEKVTFYYDYNATPGTPWQYNFGSRTFVNLPAGATGLSAVQMDASIDTIKNGRDHFQAITGPGQGADAGVPGQLAGDWSTGVALIGPGSGGGFAAPPSLMFDGNIATTCDAAATNQSIKFVPSTPITYNTKVEFYTPGTADTNLGYLYYQGTELAAVNNLSGEWTTLINGSGTFDDLRINGVSAVAAQCAAIRVDGKILVDGNILALAQNTFPNGLWWIKDRANNTNYQMLDSVRGGNLTIQSNTTQAEQPYSATSGENVAWCWSAPEAWTDNSGTLDASGYRNTTAGFSIVSYQGNQTAGATVAHGLGARPDFFAIKNRQGASDEWQVWHKDVSAVLGGNNNSLRFNSSSAAADFNAWNNTAPDNDHITLGPVTGSNGSGSDMIAYCWTSIPGFSAFGFYNGTSNDEGPYVECGFKPAMILIKRMTAVEDWVILDSTRELFNTRYKTMRINQTNAEGGGKGSNDVDFLSSGFKIRNSTDRFNGGSAYIYCAWAENPFSSLPTAN